MYMRCRLTARTQTEPTHPSAGRAARDPRLVHYLQYIRYSNGTGQYRMLPTIPTT